MSGQDGEYQVQWGPRRSSHGIWHGATSVQSHGSTSWRRKPREGRICFPGGPAAKEVYEALAQGGLCVVKELGIERVGAHVLASPTVCRCHLRSCLLLLGLSKRAYWLLVAASC